MKRQWQHVFWQLWRSRCDGCAIILHPEDVISMFPFLALSVFNYYVSMSKLFMQDISKTAKSGVC